MRVCVHAHAFFRLFYILTALSSFALREYVFGRHLGRFFFSLLLSFTLLVGPAQSYTGRPPVRSRSRARLSFSLYYRCYVIHLFSFSSLFCSVAMFISSCATALQAELALDFADFACFCFRWCVFFFSPSYTENGNAPPRHLRGF